MAVTFDVNKFFSILFRYSEKNRVETCILPREKNEKSGQIYYRLANTIQ